MTIRMKNPPHPGLFVKTEILDGHDLSVTSGAKALGVNRGTLSELINCKTSLSPDMAMRLEKAFGVSMETLLRMQASYNIAEARKREADIDVRPYSPATPAAAQPSML